MNNCEHCFNGGSLVCPACPNFKEVENMITAECCNDNRPIGDRLHDLLLEFQNFLWLHGYGKSMCSKPERQVLLAKLMRVLADEIDKIEI